MLVEQYGQMTKENADPRLERYLKTATMSRHTVKVLSKYKK